ncbi:MAG: hypothetical protein JXR96_19735 [Deltaproteobacteria bacterium]|nr:hypothetical protein [Deltaproteobacteria bacterium]
MPRVFHAAWLLVLLPACGRVGFSPEFFTCTPDGHARLCVDETCTDMGPCPLGCDEAARVCHVASNSLSALFEQPTANLDLSGAESPVVIDADSGEIRTPSRVLRAGGAGQDAASGIGFAIVPQQGGPNLGVLTVESFFLPAGCALEVVGTNAFGLVSRGDLILEGVLDVGARGMRAGPGGYDGGEPGSSGHGPCAGALGQGSLVCPDLCASGGGGAGGSFPGGDGGPVNWEPGPVFFDGAAGGGFCEASFEPIVGGSSGAGGAFPGDCDCSPGEGGGGGGAVQIVSATRVSIGAQGGIRAPGDGGGTTVNGGGAGGGAGGTILIETLAFSLADGGFLAANGGGGGAGDCT